MKFLFVNACVRGEKSRTEELCRDFIGKLPEDAIIEEINLGRIDLRPLDKNMLEQRDELLKEKNFDHPINIVYTSKSNIFIFLK